MAAVDHVHPIQMKLFMGAQEWQDTPTSSVDLFPVGKERSMPELWKNKLTESMKRKPSISHGAGVYDSIKDEGYQHDEADPPTLLVTHQNEMVQHEGHHRIAAAAKIERTTGKNIWIPTNYEERRRY